MVYSQRPLLAGSETASIPLYPTTGTLSRSDKDPKLLSAIEYLNQIKRAYEGQPQVYSYFLKTIKDFKYQIIDAPGVINRIKVLFSGHPDLVVGFTAFLPPGYKITDPEGGSTETGESRETLAFEGAGHIHSNKRLLELEEKLEELEAQGNGEERPQARSPHPLMHYPPLRHNKLPMAQLPQYSHLHPRPFQPHYTSIHQAPYHSQFSFQEQDLKSDHKDHDHEYLQFPYRSPTEIGPHFQRRNLHPQNLHLGHLPHAQYPQFQHSQYSPYAPSSQLQQPLSQGHLPSTQTFSQATQAQGAPHSSTPQTPTTSPAALPRSSPSSQSAAPQPSTTSQPHHLTSQTSLPMSIPQRKQSRPTQQAALKPEEYALNYVKRIKTRFANKPQVYKAFLKILHSYNKGERPIQEVYNQVAELLSEHPDLQQEFTHFLPDPNSSAKMPKESEFQEPKQKLSEAPDLKRKTPPEKPKRPQRGPKRAKILPDSDVSMVSPSTSQPSTETTLATMSDFELFVHLKDSLGDRLWGDFLKVAQLFIQDIISRHEVAALMHDLFHEYNMELFSDVCSFLGIDPNDLQSPAAKIAIKEESLSSTESDMQIEPVPVEPQTASSISYRPITEQDDTGRGVGRDQLCSQVLNDQWVCGPATQKNGTPVFKLAPKSHQEEMMFDLEDGRFELDLFISRLRDLKTILEEIHIGEKNIQSLTPIHTRFLKQLYSSEGQQILDLLVEHPKETIPVVLKRLTQKEDEWENTRMECEESWNQIINEKSSDEKKEENGEVKELHE